ncbi:hypothetical protein F5B22DRAFT_659524 [Xylaria bambusicola]|uniref:uncharacterized protein n=1 Tax=Xylaria bambusicola TaxID=326684 RepID=UPI002008D87B|nr:uncharacterized protein F5B22DRAFT_659524 [Xylaria bambusicola]KAI0523785.1 hypothetical protein F5B22DRAFT_659524 [Xylaria bambusicola]
MPPKRKQKEVEDISDSEPYTEAEPEIEIGREDTVKLIQRIETLANKRNTRRKAIKAEFDKYIDEMKEAIEKHHASKAEKRSNEIKALLTRRAQALEKRAAIERDIAKLIQETRENTEDLMVVLEAAYEGGCQKANDATGSFASLVTTKTAAPVPAPITPPSPMKTRLYDILGEAKIDRGEKGGHGQSDDPAKDAEHQDKRLSKADFFENIAW